MEQDQIDVEDITPIVWFESYFIATHFVLLRLPIELRLCIYDHCSAISLLMLSLTCKSLRTEINASTATVHRSFGYKDHVSTTLLSTFNIGKALCPKEAVVWINKLITPGIGLDYRCLPQSVGEIFCAYCFNLHGRNLVFQDHIYQHHEYSYVNPEELEYTCCASDLYRRACTFIKPHKEDIHLPFKAELDMEEILAPFGALADGPEV